VPCICSVRCEVVSRESLFTNPRRCERCRLSQRWCVCPAHQAIECPLAIDVLIHYREFMRPTSTGRLINRVIPASRQHLFRRETPASPETIMLPGKTLWILHPRGEPVPESPAFEGIQVLLLDASWPEAGRMSKVVAPWGRLIRLPEGGASRYWLRGQELAGKYSTVESLLFLLNALGLKNEETQLRMQFELHVYAGLRARGDKAAALEYLESSPIREAFPELLREFERRRPDTATF